MATLARPGRQVTTFTETGPVALLLADLEATRGWVWQVLGNLADDDEQATRLRETLRVFLATGGRYAATAERLTLHKNTVQYRIRKAEEAVGHPIEGHRSDVEMALRICHELGAPVLRPTPTRPRRMFYLAALPVCAPTARHGRSTSATAAKGSNQLRR